MPDVASDLLTWPLRLARDRLVVYATLPGDPLSKQRPRMVVNKSGKVYTPRHTREAEAVVQAGILARSAKQWVSTKPTAGDQRD